MAQMQGKYTDPFYAKSQHLLKEGLCIFIMYSFSAMLNKARHKGETEK